MASKETYMVPSLYSGGIMLTYECPNACRHCLYRCSPAHRESAMDEAMVDRVFSSLAAERSLSGVHLAGGEATLCWELLEYALESAARHRVRVDYLETNGHWCTSPEKAESGFRRLRDCGLRAVLISASLFHLEFIPLERTRFAMDAANEVFGGNVIVWTGDVYARMQVLEEDRTYTLKESADALGLDPGSPDIWRMHGYLTPCGRAAEVLSEPLCHMTVDDFAGERCRQTLESTSHFHIGPGGEVMTGLCPGISLATVEDIHRPRTAEEVPLYAALCQEGPGGLVPFLKDRSLLERRYMSKCHFCLEARKQIFGAEGSPELSPGWFYSPTGS